MHPRTRRSIGQADRERLLMAAAAPVSADWAQQVLRHHYCITGLASPLDGERDADFRIDRADGSRCMLKVSHPDEDRDLADFQTQALLHIARTDPGLPVQRLLPATDGAVAVQAVDSEGRPRLLRLFSYLDGQPMERTPRTTAQRRGVAATLARLDRAMAGLWHAAGQRELPWDVQYAEGVRPLMAHVADPSRRALVQQALDGFAQYTRPLLPALRRQPIHNEFSRHHLLAAPGHPDRVGGILNFGNMVEAALVGDLAVAACCQFDEGDDALACVADFAAAYHAVSPLQDIEMTVLLDLVRARLAMVVAIGGWRAARQPGDCGSLMRSNAASWARLRAVSAVSHAQAHDAIAQACRAVDR